MRCGDGSRVTRNVQARNSFQLEKTRRKQHGGELEKIQGRVREAREGAQGRTEGG